MRRRPTSPAMSLFPFLDTLVCTMGALILMLLAMTPKIKERAQARLQAQAAAQAAAAMDSDPEPEPEPSPPAAAQPEPEIVPEKVVVAAAPDRAQLEAEHAAERNRRRQAWARSAAEARDKLAARQADYRSRRQLLKDADQRLKDLQDQILKAQLKSESVDKAEASLAAAADRLEAQQERVAQEIANTRKNIDVLQRRQAAAKNEYSLVPYDGTSGTVRRPVYIECTGRGFRFLPEDETISPDDLAGFTDNYNPLLTGAQSLVRFWARRRRNSPQTEPEPYVLLLVRPSGCFTYYLARKYLSSLNVNFGYELIEEDWKLSVPDADPIAKSVLKETLDTTVQAGRPANLSFADSGRDGFGGFGDEDFSRSPRASRFGSGGGDDDRGGFGNRNGSLNRDADGFARGTGRSPGVKFGPATRAARNGPGSATNGDELADGSGSGAAGTKGAGTSATGTNSAGKNDKGAGGRTPAGRGAKPAGIGNGTGAGAGNGAGSSEGSAGTSDSEELAGGSISTAGLGRDGSGRSGSGSPGSGLSGRAANGTGRGGSGRRGGARPASLGGNSPDIGDGDGSGDGGDAVDEPNATVAAVGSEPAMGGSGSGSDSLLAPLSDDSDEPVSLNPFSPRSGGPAAANGPLTRGARSGSPLAAPSGANSSSAARSSNSSAANAPGSSGSSQGDPLNGDPSAGGSASNVQFGGPGATINLGSSKKSKLKPKDEDPDDGPRISEDNGKTGGALSRSRGPRKWGQVGKKASTGYEKTIEIRLTSDRILVGSKDVAVPVKPSDSNDEIVHRVVNAIDHVADKWGEPMEGYYWVPAVKFVVYPGGETYSETLSKVLEKQYSVNSTIEFADDKPAKKAVPRGRP